MPARRYRATIEDKMKDEAKLGFAYAYLKITKKKSVELSNLGFEVSDSHDSRYYPRLHRISWEKAKVEYDDYYALNENDKNLSLPQRLWITTLKSGPFRLD